jgi:hypothetical protein
VKLPVLFYAFLLAEIATAIVGGFRYRNLPRPLRILEWLVILSVLEVGVQWPLAYYHINNLWVSHFYTVIELFFVAWVYSLWMKKHQHRIMLALSLSVFFLFWMVSKFTFEPLSLLNGWTAAFSKILQIMFLLVNIVKESDVVWTSDARVWVAAGVVIYSAGSLFYYTLFNLMLQVSPDRLRLVLSLNWFLMLVANVLYMRGFLCKS